jgi:hypothetical protein
LVNGSEWVSLIPISYKSGRRSGRRCKLSFDPKEFLVRQEVDLADAKEALEYRQTCEKRGLTCWLERAHTQMNSNDKKMKAHMRVPRRLKAC